MTKFCLVLLLAAACGDNHQLAAPDAPAPPSPDAAVDAPPDGPDVNPACLAPFVMPVDPNAQAAAQAELATLAPSADMTCFAGG